MCIAGLSRLLKFPTGDPFTTSAWNSLLHGCEQSPVRPSRRSTTCCGAGSTTRKPIEVRLLARHAAVTFVGIAKEDHKIRSSVYSTAVLALKPWLEPSVAHSASANARHSYASKDAYAHVPRFVDLEWLMAGPDGRANTLYLAAPSAEFERLSPVLGGLLADLKDTIHAWDIAGKPLEKPLLIVIDEAAQLQLGWLPTEVSTIAALGAFFVTCWQNLAQIHHRYGTLADAVLSGHRTKCFFAGVDDPATTRYLTGLLGHEQVARFSKSHDVPSMWSSSTPRQAKRQPVHAARGVRSGPLDQADVPRPGGAAPRHAAAGAPRRDPLVGGRRPPRRDSSRRGWPTCERCCRHVPADGSQGSTDEGCRCRGQRDDSRCQGATPVRASQEEEGRVSVECSWADAIEEGTQRRRAATGHERNVDTDDPAPTSTPCSLCEKPIADGRGRWIAGKLRCAPDCSSHRRPSGSRGDRIGRAQPSRARRPLRTRPVDDPAIGRRVPTSHAVGIVHTMPGRDPPGPERPPSSPVRSTRARRPPASSADLINSHSDRPGLARISRNRSVLFTPVAHRNTVPLAGLCQADGR